MLKILRSLGKSRESQKSSLISKENVNKEDGVGVYLVNPVLSKTFFVHASDCSAWIPAEQVEPPHETPFSRGAIMHQKQAYRHRRASTGAKKASP